MRSRRIVGVLLACVVPGLYSGCGKNDRASLGRVTGTVQYDGKPLDHGMIVFYPDKGRSASGTIKAGKIADVSTYDPGDGAPLGHVKVVVTSVDNPKADMYTPTTSLIPEKYTQLQTTDLEATIKGGTNTLDFKLQN